MRIPYFSERQLQYMQRAYRSIQQAMPFYRRIISALSGWELDATGKNYVSPAVRDIEEQIAVEGKEEVLRTKVSDLRLPWWARVWRLHGLLRVRSDGMYIFLGRNQGMIAALHQKYLYCETTLPALCALFVDKSGEPIDASSVNKHGPYLLPKEVEAHLDRVRPL